MAFGCSDVERVRHNCAKSIYGLSTEQLRQGGHFVVQTQILSQDLCHTMGGGLDEMHYSIWSDVETRDKGGWTSHRSCLSTVSGSH